MDDASCWFVFRRFSSGGSLADRKRGNSSLEEELLNHIREYPELDIFAHCVAVFLNEAQCDGKWHIESVTRATKYIDQFGVTVRRNLTHIYHTSTYRACHVTLDGNWAGMDDCQNFRLSTQVEPQWFHHGQPFYRLRINSRGMLHVKFAPGNGGTCEITGMIADVLNALAVLPMCS
jgi:hypothetical protein